MLKNNKDIDNLRKRYQFIKKFSEEKDSKRQIFSKLFINKLSLLVVTILEKTKITPNHLTLISLMFGLFTSLSLILLQTYIGLILAALFFYFFLLFDIADGQLARWQNTQSEFGAWWDTLVGNINQTILIISIMIRLCPEKPITIVIGIGVVLCYIFAKRKNLFLKSYKKKKRNPSIDAILHNFTEHRNKLPRKILFYFSEQIFHPKLLVIFFFLINRPAYAIYINGLKCFFWCIKGITFLISRKYRP